MADTSKSPRPSKGEKVPSQDGTLIPPTVAEPQYLYGFKFVFAFFCLCIILFLVVLVSHIATPYSSGSCQMD